MSPKSPHLLSFRRMDYEGVFVVRRGSEEVLGVFSRFSGALATLFTAADEMGDRLGAAAGVEPHVAYSNHLDPPFQTTYWIEPVDVWRNAPLDSEVFILRQISVDDNEGTLAIHASEYVFDSFDTAFEYVEEESKGDFNIDRVLREEHVEIARLADTDTYPWPGRTLAVLAVVKLRFI